MCNLHSENTQMNKSINSIIKKIVMVFFLLTTTTATFAMQLVYCPSSIHCLSDNLYQCSFNEDAQFFKVSAGRLKKAGGTYLLKMAIESNSAWGHSTGCNYVLDNYFVALSNKDQVILHPFINQGAPWQWDKTNRSCEANGNPQLCPFSVD
jgi:hypothetical protein